MGDRISISDHAWVPGSFNYKVDNVNRNNNVSMVADLLYNISRVQRRKVITNTFMVDDAKRILRIPLVREALEDELAWRGEASGEFFIWSTYKLLHTSTLMTTLNEVQIISKKYYKSP